MVQPLLTRISCIKLSTPTRPDRLGPRNGFPSLSPIVFRITFVRDLLQNLNWQQTLEPGITQRGTSGGGLSSGSIFEELAEERRDSLIHKSLPLLSDGVIDSRDIPGHTDGRLPTKALQSLVIQNLFPAESNFLGNLTTNKVFPRPDFHLPMAPPSPSRIDIIVQDSPRTIQTSFIASNSPISSFSIRLTNTNEEGIFEVDRSRFCVPKNSGQ